MIDTKVRLLSEGFARIVNRRQFLKRAGEVSFFSLAALAAGGTLGSSALASGKSGSPVNNPPQCAPPGPYCNTNGINEPNGCNGGSCFQHRHLGLIYQCRVYYQWYQAGCWTTYVSGGYWVCCDCECGQPRVASCGCAQFSTQPKPRPDGPAAG